MELRHDDFGGGYTFFSMDINRDTTTIVRYGYPTVSQYAHIHPGGMSSDRLIYRVVGNLFDKVMYTVVASATNIHTWTLTNRLQAFEHLNLIG